jgi:hypothetical protein
VWHAVGEREGDLAATARRGELPDGLMKELKKRGIPSRSPHPDDEHGQWACGTPGCDGAGLNFDLIPVNETTAGGHVGTQVSPDPGGRSIGMVSVSYENLLGPDWRGILSTGEHPDRVELADRLDNDPFNTRPPWMR